MWWKIAKADKNSLIDTVLESLKEAIKVTEDELCSGEQDIMDPLEIFENSGDQLLFDMVSFGLSIGNKVLINQPRGFFIDFLKDAAFSVLYARTGMVGIESLAMLPLEINPYKDRELVKLISYNGGIKLFFGTSEPREALLLTKKGEKLEIMLSSSKDVIFVNPREYAQEVEKYTLSGVRDLEKIVSNLNPLKVLRPRLQWIKAILKHSKTLP
ncbi:MAG: hypothetical protein GXO39_01505 [Thermotogae bacterium]|nr:hypothetical protein [Thermotogota bacterium]